MTLERCDDPRERAAAHDLRRVCIHELAHLAVARHFGACGFVTLVRVARNEARYAGRFQMHGELADDEWRVVALAGTIAELIDDVPAIEARAVLVRLLDAPWLLSTLDARLAAGYDARDVAQCVSILRGAWTSIVADAAERCACEDRHA